MLDVRQKAGARRQHHWPLILADDTDKKELSLALSLRQIVLTPIRVIRENPRLVCAASDLRTSDT